MGYCQSIYIYYLSNIATEKKRKKKGPHSIKSSSSFRCSITPSMHAGMQFSGLSFFLKKKKKKSAARAFIVHILFLMCVWNAP